MPDTQDMDLVREFARQNSEAAFTELVRRHIALVFSVARRCTGNDSDAEDVTQAVFIILARKAAGLCERTLLPGWLYETTRFTAARLLRTNARRQQREQEAYMQSTMNEDDTADVWERLSPHLEDAMFKLAERDHALLVLRFYQNKSGPEAAALLGIREGAAHMRVTRAIEKLRKFFTKRGVTISGEAIAGAISANSVQAAPVALAKSVTAVAIAKGAAASTSTLTLIKGALKIMAWTKPKMAVVVGVGMLLVAGTITEAVIKKVEARNYTVAHEPWSDMGAASPKAVVQTLVWAATNGKNDRVEALMQWEDTGSYDNSGSALAHKLTVATYLIPAIQRMESFRILSIDTTSQPDEAMVTIEKTFKKIPNVPETFPYSVTLKLHRVGNQWRVIGNIKYQENEPATLTLPFIGSF